MSNLNGLRYKFSSVLLSEKNNLTLIVIVSRGSISKKKIRRKEEVNPDLLVVEKAFAS